MKNLVSLSAIFLVLVILASCKSEEQQAQVPFVNPPFPHLTPPSTDFSFNADQGGELLFEETGTTITVPPGIWVDAQGNKVSGEVKLAYREFHDALDVFLAGVTMEYDSAGTPYTLQTAGMFELLAYKDTSEIFIEPGKKLTVRMASYDANPDFSFYSLDEENENWSYAGYAEPEENSTIQQIRDSIEEMQPQLAFPLDDNYFALDYSALLDVYYRENDQKISKYGKSRALKNKFKSYGISWAKIYGYTSIKYHGIDYRAYQILWKNLSQRRLPGKKQSAYIDEMKYFGNDVFLMTIKQGNVEKKYKVEAVMPLRALFANNPDTWKQNYDSIMASIKREEERLKMQSAVFRTFDVTATGFHNWDKIYNREDKIIVNADFKFDKEIDQTLADLQIYYFVENNKSFITIPPSDWGKVMLVPDSTAKMVAVLSDKEAAVFSTSQYKKIDFEKLKNSKQYTFPMTTHTIASKEDFLNFLN